MTSLPPSQRTGVDLGATRRQFLLDREQGSAHRACAGLQSVHAMRVWSPHRRDGSAGAQSPDR
jgi:hypothetical protein